MVLAVACSSGDAAGSVDSLPSPPPSSAAPASTSPSSAPTTASETTTPAPEESERAYDFSAIDPIVQEFVDANGLNGAALVVVERDDGIVHEQYWGEFDADRVSLVASASKMLVAGVLMRLDDQGLLDVDAPVADAVVWGAGNPTVTPAQLLSNSSGLVGLGPDVAYRPYLCQFLPVGDLQSCGSGIFTTPEDDADVLPPDTEFRYGGGQWQVAGALAEAVSGRSWDALLAETYRDPCGAASLGFNNHWTQFGLDFDYPEAFGGDPASLTPTANPNIEGGGYTTARDYARILLMHLNEGRCGDEQVLSAEAVARMHADRVGATYGTADGGGGYGLGWWIDPATGRLTDPGAFGAVPWLDLGGGHGAILVIEADGTTGKQLATSLFDPVAEAVAAAR
jgi:CubicO group peptidase (beta-lactamase class C family)